jgi:tripeptide aminopeptidase
MLRVIGFLSMFLCVTAMPASADAAEEALTPVARIEVLRRSLQYQSALAIISRDHDRLVAENIKLTEIPAPPFKEEAKAKVFREMLGESGLSKFEMDAEGNVLALRKGIGNGPLLAVAAHLDTVFPEVTDVKVKRDGNKLRAPGIADDTRGLAAMLAIARAMGEAELVTESDILFVGSVGEEGLGDLRGAKHLFLKGPYKGRIGAFISLDGIHAERLVTTAVGSRRYRLTFAGPGGHSYSAFGTVNPMYAMGAFLTQFGTINVPPLTTYSAGVTGGGTSVNAIPVSTWLEIDMRSTEPSELNKMESQMREFASAAVAAENKARSTKDGEITVKIDLIGDRPAGATMHPLLGAKQPATAAASGNLARNSQLAEFAWEAIAAAGLKPEADASSTDANVAMNLGIPAITISAGVGDRIHSLDEWLDVDKGVSVRQMDIVMATILAAAGMRK